MAKPEKVFKAGAIRASVFVNSFTNSDGRTVPIRKVVLEVRYKDKNGQWQGTNSLSLNDLPKAMSALQHAYEYLLAENSAQPQQDESSTRHPLPADSAPSAPVSSRAPGSPRLVGTKRF